jgi:D-alanine-D-alanine ligase
MSKRLSIVVLLGGPSAEREVSLRTGASVATALRSLGHEVHELDPKPGALKLPAGTDAVFIALHGTYGEDGTVQQELDELGVPYAGCGVQASAISFDKMLAKQRFAAAGLDTPRSELIDKPGRPWPRGWNPPVVLKPVRQGSSVGLEFINAVSEWTPKLAEAFRHDTQVLMEQRILGREVTVAVLDGEPLPVVEVRPRSGDYDYRNKYTAGATEYFCPADFPAAQTKAIQLAALTAFESVGARDYARIDVMVDGGGRPWILEVNTLPGMTDTSLFPKAAAAAGIPYAELCGRMISLALRRAPAAKG